MRVEDASMSEDAGKHTDIEATETHVVAVRLDIPPVARLALCCKFVVNRVPDFRVTGSRTRKNPGN